MRYEWLDQYCMSKKGAHKDFKVEWDATRYLLFDKMFLMQGGDKYGKPIVTVKCEPEFGQFLRTQYKYIVPGYYMNKEHWNSLYLEGDTPDDVLREMIDRSYNLILGSLTKAKQKQLSE